MNLKIEAYSLPMSESDLAAHDIIPERIALLDYCTQYVLLFGPTVVCVSIPKV